MNANVVWITGAHGFIGRHLGRHLQSSGRAVFGIGHGAWPATDASRSGICQWLNGEIVASNLNQLRSLSGLPAQVIHLAGGSSVGVAIAQPREDFVRTVTTTVELLDWLRQESPETVLVAASSAAIYGAGNTGPIAEITAPRPYSPYGFHKSIMESLCRSYGASYGLKSVIARLFSVYGTGLKKQLLWDLCGAIARSSNNKIQLGGSGEELRDWTEVRDVVEILGGIGGLASPEVPIFNVGRGEGVSVRDIARLVISAWKGRNIIELSFNGRARAGDPFSLIANTELLARHGLTCATPVSRGVAGYVEWFKTDSASSA